MNHRERLNAILHYEAADRMPVVHFGYWRELLARWAAEGHISREDATEHRDGNPADLRISSALGFDFNYQTMFRPVDVPLPGFETEVLEVLEDGTEHVRNSLGAVVTRKADAGSIPAEIDHLLKDRSSWETHFRWRLAWNEARVLEATVPTPDGPLAFGSGGREYLIADDRDFPIGLHGGSMYGLLRSIVGIENLIYLSVDDEPLLDEMLETFGELGYQSLAYTLATGARFDFTHFWEDIAFKNGPLVNPAVFRAKVGPHYRRIADLVAQHGIDLVSVDCDGKIDDLVPVWLDHGVNVMFPIEVGTWGASILPWRQKFGKAIRGVGGVNKHVVAQDRAAVDTEIERMRPLVDLGGFVPCPDHRLPPNADWDLTRYYCDRMRKVFS